MERNRLEALTDGVFAIVITLLIFDIKVPDDTVFRNLSTGLLFLGPKLVAYIVSFLVLAVWWVSHHRLIALIDRVDTPLLWLNNLFLLSIAFLPFPTTLVGTYTHRWEASIAYGATCTLAGVFFVAMRHYIVRCPALHRSAETVPVIEALWRTSWLGPVAYAAATLLAFWEPYAALAMFGLIPVYFAVVAMK